MNELMTLLMVYQVRSINAPFVDNKLKKKIVHAIMNKCIVIKYEYMHWELILIAYSTEKRFIYIYIYI